jgi:hypothetical protein
MRFFFNLLTLLAIGLLSFAACGGEPAPSLAVADQPTLVFIYTDG